MSYIDQNVIRKPGYSFYLVNIDCMPTSDHFNVVMDMEESIEELLPYLAAGFLGCTYIHGTGVINLMDAGHIVAIYPRQITITDLRSIEEGERLCGEYFQKIAEVKATKESIRPVFEKRPSLTVLDILRRLPKTGCGLCGCTTCMAFAAGVFRREIVIASCPPLALEPEKYRDLFNQLRANGYDAP